MRLRRRKIEDHEKYEAYLNFVTYDGTTITSLEHDIPLAEMLKRMTVKIGGVKHYRISYPTLGTSGWDNFKEDVIGTMPQEVMVPVGMVHRVWKQSKPNIPRWGENR